MGKCFAGAINADFELAYKNEKMATLTHDAEYACAFELKLLDWERYSPKKNTDRPSENPIPYGLNIGWTCEQEMVIFKNFWVYSSDIERFTFQLEAELRAIGGYIAEKEER